MAEKIHHIRSISEMHKMAGLPGPSHPLISVVDAKALQPRPEMMGDRFTLDYYVVSKKMGSCGLNYGRNRYDFEEGVLSFFGPQQVLQPNQEDYQDDLEGWMLLFHPDLIRHSHLGPRMDEYTFFSYDVHEALHLSDKEQQLLDDCIAKIEYEFQQSIDGHSNNLFVTHLELILNYSMRFYERQFHTRKRHHADILTQVEGLLRDYYHSELQLDSGTPSIQYIADRVNLSPNYLSDLLKKETGRNAKDHINTFVIERAKTLLLSSNQHVREIAFHLGFNYPHYFSRMFKAQVGMSPKEYRELDLN